MFQGDELADAHTTDLSKVQMFFFTIVSAVVFLGTADAMFTNMKSIGDVLIPQLPGEPDRPDGHQPRRLPRQQGRDAHAVAAFRSGAVAAAGARGATERGHIDRSDGFARDPAVPSTHRNVLETLAAAARPSRFPLALFDVRQGSAEFRGGIWLAGLRRHRSQIRGPRR